MDIFARAAGLSDNSTSKEIIDLAKDVMVFGTAEIKRLQAEVEEWKQAAGVEASERRRSHNEIKRLRDMLTSLTNFDLYFDGSNVTDFIELKDNIRLSLENFGDQMDLVDKLKSAYSWGGDPLHRDAWEEIEQLRKDFKMLELAFSKALGEAVADQAVKNLMTTGSLSGK